MGLADNINDTINALSIVIPATVLTVTSVNGENIRDYLTSQNTHNSKIMCLYNDLRFIEYENKFSLLETKIEKESETNFYPILLGCGSNYYKLENRTKHYDI